MKPKKQKEFTLRAISNICYLRADDRYSTAHVYESALNSFSKFLGKDNILFKFINRDNLKRYESYLKEHKCTPNTISTYMRALRCTYNKAVDEGQVKHVPRLFFDVFTGIESVKKKALPVETLQVLLQEPTRSEKLQETQSSVNVMFQFCGMPFVDLAHLEIGNIKNETLEYHRKKSGTSIKIEVLPRVKEVIDKIKTQGSKYLFPFLSGVKKGEEAFVEYRSALSKFNRQLGVLAKDLGIKEHITSYSIRHSFATALKLQKVPIEMISELLGHKSIKTTQIYLQSFSLKELSEINKSNYDFVANYVPETLC